MDTAGKEQEQKTGLHGVKTGVVARVSGDKTVSVSVNTVVPHPRYGKYVKRQRKYAVHDPDGRAGVGDVVEIVGCRPISKNKSWRLVRVVRPSANRA